MPYVTWSIADAWNWFVNVPGLGAFLIGVIVIFVLLKIAHQFQ